jgi:hypothetical protein
MLEPWRIINRIPPPLLTTLYMTPWPATLVAYHAMCSNNVRQDLDPAESSGGSWRLLAKRDDLAFVERSLVICWQLRAWETKNLSVLGISYYGPD